jgi:hypothetical protein
VSVGPNGVEANGRVVTRNAIGPQAMINPDGTVVAFVSAATNLDASVTNRSGTNDVFVRDLITGTNETVSTDGAGSTLRASSVLQGLSDDGRYVLFEAGGTVYLTDRVLGTRTVIADGTDPFSVCGTLASDGIAQARMNGNASKIALEQRCRLSALPTGNDVDHVVVLDRALGTTVDAHSFTTPRRTDGLGRMSYASNADLLVWPESSVAAPTSEIMAWTSTRGAFNLIGSAVPLLDAYASRTGRYVAFTELVGGATQVWLFDRNIDGLTVVSETADGRASSGSEPVIADDEGTMVFTSSAGDLVSGDTNAVADVFTRPISSVFGAAAISRTTRISRVR